MACYLLDVRQYSHLSFGKEYIYVCADVCILGRKLCCIASEENTFQERNYQKQLFCQLAYSH